MRALDIAIAGCGVAGLASGTLLARAGHRVSVFDRLETPSPLGSGLILQPVGLYVLDQLGVGDRMRALGAPIHRLYGRVRPSERIVLDVRYASLEANAPTGLAVHRGALFELLFDAAREAGVALVTGREIVAAREGVLMFADGRASARFDLAIDALGSRSILASVQHAPLSYGALWANVAWRDGFDPHTLEQRYEQARKMAGVLPIGRLTPDAPQQAAFFWSLKGVDFEAWRKQPIEHWREQVLHLWPETEPLVSQIDSHEQLVFARYLHRTLAKPVAHKLAHIGDSWHSASPQLGQGANMALLDALALATAMARESELDAALALYARLRSWHIRLYQAVSFLFTPAYQSDSALIAALRDYLVAPLSRIPPAPRVLAALVAGAWGSPLKAMGVR